MKYVYELTCGEKKSNLQSASSRKDTFPWFKTINFHSLNYHFIEEEKADQSKDSDDAGQLSDEGLGDITSEASNSPQPPPKDPDSLTNNNENELENYLHSPSPRTSPKSSSEKSEKERLHCDNPRKAFMENLIEGDY